MSSQRVLLLLIYESLKHPYKNLPSHSLDGRLTQGLRVFAEIGRLDLFQYLADRVPSRPQGTTRTLPKNPCGRETYWKIRPLLQSVTEPRPSIDHMRPVLCIRCGLK